MALGVISKQTAVDIKAQLEKKRAEEAERQRQINSSRELAYNVLAAQIEALPLLPYDNVTIAYNRIELMITVHIYAERYSAVARNDKTGLYSLRYNNSVKKDYASEKEAVHHLVYPLVEGGVVDFSKIEASYEAQDV